LYGQDLNKVVDQLQHRYAQIEGFSAHFRQIYTSNLVKQEESGLVYMKKPGRMRWEYQKPEVKLFISDGKRSYFYVPEDNQVTVQSFSAADIHSVPLSFLLGRGDVRRDFDVQWETKETKLGTKNYLLRLTPKTPQSAFALLLLEISPQDYHIERLIVADQTGDRSEFIFTQFDPKAKIEDGKFKFKIPKNAEVLNADTK
jgi:outer membrane lipoprotein carrier protein